MEVLQKLYEETKAKYSLRLLAGERGMTNTVSWIYLMEDVTHYPFLKESELVVTTGLVYKSEEQLVRVVEDLIERNASGLIINTGQYIFRISDSLKQLCDREGFPLFEMPWESSIASLSRDCYERILTDDLKMKSLRGAMIALIEDSAQIGRYEDVFREYEYDMEGHYSCAVLTFDDGENHPSDFFREVEIICCNSLNMQDCKYVLFHYRNRIVLVTCELSQEAAQQLMEDVQRKLAGRRADWRSHAGIGGICDGVAGLSKSYEQACAACEIAEKDGALSRKFEDIGVYKLLFSVKDPKMLCDYASSVLQPVIDYDMQHHSDFLQTLKLYIEYGSNVQRVAEEACMHRNTVNYRVRRMKEMLNNPMEYMSQTFSLQMAFYIMDLYPDLEPR
jgi:hypothetical protein